MLIPESFRKSRDCPDPGPRRLLSSTATGGLSHTTGRSLEVSSATRSSFLVSFLSSLPVSLLSTFVFLLSPLYVFYSVSLCSLQQTLPYFFPFLLLSCFLIFPSSSQLLASFLFSPLFLPSFCPSFLLFFSLLSEAPTTRVFCTHYCLVA